MRFLQLIGPLAQRDAAGVLGFTKYLVQRSVNAHVVGTVAVLLLIVACVPGRPARLIEPDSVGVVSAVDSSVGRPLTVRFEDGREVEVPRDATELYSGITTGGLLLVGEDFGRSWYAGLVADQVYSIDGCFVLKGVAYDEPDAVIVLSRDWDGVGLRVQKDDDLVIPEEFLDSEGKYRMGGEFPEGAFCVDSTGTVFGFQTSVEERL